MLFRSGNMNGLRGIFEQSHADLGSHCSTELLDWVVTVGEKANMYLAPAARQKGCQVKECRNAIEAGAFVRDKLKPEGIALFKGSSGGVIDHIRIFVSPKPRSEILLVVQLDVASREFHKFAGK